VSETGDIASVVVPVFRDGERALEAISALLSQTLPPGTTLDIVVVDDGSADGTAQHLAAIVDPRLRVLALPYNVGRSSARNAGAAAARGTRIVFMDCDCLPVDAHFISAHLHALESAVASTGRVTGNDDGFWHRYQQEASLRRERQHAAGTSFSGSSQNLAVRAADFAAIGGFDSGYRQYGFEDRDLLLRLAQQGRVAWTPAAVVRHRDALRMADVARKMAEAGRHSSARFASMHPAAYGTLGYARLDARRYGALTGVARVIARALPGVARGVDILLAAPLPHAAKVALVRGTTALAYWCGTACADDAAPSPKR
jgi:glycosyltransferase involved in cell wall biosynthesis